MVARQRTPGDNSPRGRRPPATSEGMEDELIAKAMKLAAQRIEDGTASAQEIVHFLRLGSPRERLEREKLKRENDLLEAKAVAVGRSGEQEQLLTEALAMFKKYSGQGSDDQEDYDD